MGRGVAVGIVATIVGLAACGGAAEEPLLGVWTVASHTHDDAGCVAPGVAVHRKYNSNVKFVGAARPGAGGGAVSSEPPPQPARATRAQPRAAAVRKEMMARDGAGIQPLVRFIFCNFLENECVATAC